ncbi:MULTISPECIES: dermonecrotic toxin domain-containing protein [unclassified Pseudomonas]|uniref:dermonecrotic toxin domain-containing protein n=1 Tax=unclassified Pseudomonas TaxID=196821 RepID=UPI0021142C9C|nr:MULTISPECIES: DUF6543 domain-containing protein [unclassified Pseudomonas]
MPPDPHYGAQVFGLSRPLKPEVTDEVLLLDAIQRWQECHRDMQALIAGTPSVRSTISQMIHDHWQLNAELTGIEFMATALRGTCRISLIEACLYMQQRPAMDTTQVPKGSVVGLPENHVLSGYTLSMLLDELKGMDLEQALKDAWTGYFWHTRAPLQPQSCRARAAELYHIHFEASAEAQLAQGTLSDEAVKLIRAVIDPPQAGQQEQKVCAEQMFLTGTTADTRVLPGAWVLTPDTDQPVQQLLYLPAHQPAWRTFSKRTDMERWLLEQQRLLFSTPQDDPFAQIEYQVKQRPLETGITLWLGQLADAQYRATIHALPALEIEDAYQARQKVEAFDQQRREQSPFATAPLPPTSRVKGTGTLAQFGHLHPGLGLSERQSAVQHQRDALDALLTHDTTTTSREARLRPLKQLMGELRAQQQTCERAARQLLQRRPLDITTLNTQFTALYQARLAGLRLEAGIQRTLNQISTDEFKLIEIALAAPLSEDRSLAVSVCSMTLAVTEKNNATSRITTSELKGPLVITASPNLEVPPTNNAIHLVYWPGRDGALQRFASRAALQESLFQISAEDTELALHLTELTGNAFEHSLSQQQLDCDEQMAETRSRGSAAALEELRETLLPSLLLPEHSARAAALLEIEEQDNSSRIAEKLPVWLNGQTAEQREQFKNQLKRYIRALERAEVLSDQSLMPRDEFVRQHLDARLRKDFSLTQAFTVKLDLPVSVRSEQRPVPGGSGVGGTPVRVHYTPSQARSTLSLDELALSNVDDATDLRLRFLSVDVTAEDAAEQAILKAGITREYLIRTVRELNLAGAYETRIYQAFKGTPAESMFQVDYRRECLSAPLRLMLVLQGEMALRQHHISADEHHLLDIAIHANTREGWETGDKRIVLLPAILTVGDADTTTESPVTLSGITFIHERTSGVTLLYLPDAPDERYLRRFDSLEQARQRLFDLCSLDTMINYVAGRAITGPLDGHISRIDQAVVKRYDAIIGVGSAWPATTSLTEHLLDAHMGRLIEANRTDARSNEDLARERYALRSGHLFNGIRIALSFVPYIGTAISLVDGVTSLYSAVDAFRHGEVHHGIEQLVSAFDSLVYAGMDALVFAAPPAGKAATARTLTRQHQLRHPTRQSFWRNVKSRQAAPSQKRFAGYEHPRPLSVGSLQAVHAGPYRNTLRHRSGDHFIINEGRYFKVKFDPTTHEMRLITPGKSYMPAIALDEAMQWDTYAAVHGGHLTGYGGGSRHRQRARRGSDMPAAVERQLPAPVSRVNAQRDAQLAEYDQLCRTFDAQLGVTMEKLVSFQQEHLISRRPQDRVRRYRETKELDALLASEIADCIRQHEMAETLAQLPGETLRQQIKQNQVRVAHIISERLVHRAKHAQAIGLDLLEEITEIKARLASTPLWSAAHVALLDELKRVRLQFVNEWDLIGTSTKSLRTWYKRVTEPVRRNLLKEDVLPLLEKHSENTLLTTRMGQLLETVGSRPKPTDVTWVLQEKLLHDLRIKLDISLASQLQLPDANISKVQRNQFLENLIKVYEQAHRDLISWNVLSPDHFDPTCLQPLLDGLTQLTHQARRSLRKSHTPAPAGRRTVFETEDGQLRLGVQESPRQFLVSNEKGVTVEVWEQMSDSHRYRLNIEKSRPVDVPPALPTDTKMLVDEARKRLDAVDALENTVNSYKTMEPVNLEHMLVSEAHALESRARIVQNHEAGNPLVEQLLTRADRLKRAGETLRIQRTVESQKPTEGYLDYLMSKGRLEVRKLGTRKKLRDKRPDGQPDYLQEYALHDTTTPQAPVLWYAHFHYVAEHSAFDSFAKAHIKLRAQQYLGMKWQTAQREGGATFADTNIWRGNIDLPIANQYFLRV